MEEELNTKNTEIVDDMPDFEENAPEMPSESEKSVDNQSADTENAILNEEKSEKSEEKADKKAKPKQTFKSNLPTGFSFNPLVIAIKPFYDKLVADDEIFANIVKERESREKKPKSLSECADYIISEAYNYAKNHKQGNMGMAGFPDEEMPILIRHYYDEEWLEVQPMRGASVSVNHTTPTTPVAPTKKGKEKPKQPKNVLDITKAIVSATAKETGKKGKKKDSLLAGFVPMERPATEKDAKKGSREQAKSVEQMDMFADFFANEE